MQETRSSPHFASESAGSSPNELPRKISGTELCTKPLERNTGSSYWRCRYSLAMWEPSDEFGKRSSAETMSRRRRWDRRGFCSDSNERSATASCVCVGVEREVADFNYASLAIAISMTTMMNGRQRSAERSQQRWWVHSHRPNESQLRNSIIFHRRKHSDWLGPLIDWR